MSIPNSHAPPLKPSDFHVLMVLSEGKRHGYGIMKAVEEQSGGSVRLQLGTLYHLISRLEASKLIEEVSGDRSEKAPGRTRRYYRLTTLGKSTLRVEARRLADLVKVVTKRRILEDA